MTKSDNRKLFQAVERDDWSTIDAILQKYPGEIDTFGIHNRLCRDKTPLMYAMQCENFALAKRFIDLGADVCAKMAGGPEMSVLALAAKFGHGLNPNHDRWVTFASELIQRGADPTDALWPALAAYDIRNGKSGMVKLLVDAGADLDSEIPAGKIRDLVRVNEHLFADEVLAMCGIKKRTASS